MTRTLEVESADGTIRYQTSGRVELHGTVDGVWVYEWRGGKTRNDVWGWTHRFFIPNALRINMGFE